MSNTQHDSRLQKLRSQFEHDTPIALEAAFNVLKNLNVKTVRLELSAMPSNAPGVRFRLLPDAHEMPGDIAKTVLFREYCLHDETVFDITPPF